MTAAAFLATAALAAPVAGLGAGAALQTLRQARLTARTEAGRTIVDAEVLESGRTTIHTARTCYPD